MCQPKNSRLQVTRICAKILKLRKKSQQTKEPSSYENLRIWDYWLRDDR